MQKHLILGKYYFPFHFNVFIFVFLFIRHFLLMFDAVRAYFMEAHEEKGKIERLPGEISAHLHVWPETEKIVNEMSKLQ